MPTDAEQSVEGAFRVLFQRAAEAGDQARREAARGVSPEQAFEDGRLLTFYQVTARPVGLSSAVARPDRQIET